jgi:hypothetical protein
MAKVRLEGVHKLKMYNELIGNQTRVFPVCSIVPEATTLPHRESSVGIATGYGLDDRGVGVPVPLELIIFSSPRLPYRIWGPLSLLSNVYRGLFPRG